MKIATILLVYLWWTITLATFGFLAMSYKSYHENLAKRGMDKETAEIRYKFICADMARAAEMRLVSECDAYRATMTRDPRTWAFIDTMEAWRLCGAAGCYEVISDASDRIVWNMVILFLLFVAFMVISKKLIGFTMSKAESTTEYLPTIARGHLLESYSKSNGSNFRIRSITSRADDQEYRAVGYQSGTQPHDKTKYTPTPYLVEYVEHDDPHRDKSL